MLRKILNAIDPVTRSTGAALLCSVLTEFSTPRRPELCSETLAWLMLLTVFKIEKQCGNDGPSKAGLPPESPNKPVSSVSVWIAALGIAMFCILRAEMKLMGFFVSPIDSKALKLP